MRFPVVIPLLGDEGEGGGGERDASRVSELAHSNLDTPRTCTCAPAWLSGFHCRIKGRIRDPIVHHCIGRMVLN